MIKLTKTHRYSGQQWDSDISLGNGSIFHVSYEDPNTGYGQAIVFYTYPDRAPVITFWNQDPSLVWVEDEIPGKMVLQSKDAPAIPFVTARPLAFHPDGEVEILRRRVAELEAALAAVDRWEKVASLRGGCECGSPTCNVRWDYTGQSLTVHEGDRKIDIFLADDIEIHRRDVKRDRVTKWREPDR